MLQLKDFKQKDQTSNPGSQEQRYHPISSQLNQSKQIMNDKYKHTKRLASVQHLGPLEQDLS